MDYVTLRTRVAQETGIDLTQDATMVGAWINATYQYISGLFNWPWLMKHSTFQTTADITTGTVSVTAGSTTVTFSSAPTSSVANDYMIKFPTTSDDWYYISSHTAASTTATMSVGFTGSSNISGASYILRRVFYSMASDVDRVDDMRQTITDRKLEPIDIRTFDRLIPDPTFTGTPVYYSLLGVDSSNNWRLALYPTPNATINMQLRYYQRITELSADSDSPVIPLKWQSALVFGALAMYGHDFIDDSRVKDAIMRFQSALSEMTLHYSHVPDIRYVIQPWDTRARSNEFALRFPSTFPEYFR